MRHVPCLPALRVVAALPGVQKHNPGWLEVHQIAGNDGYAMHKRCGSDQPVPDWPGIGDVQSRGAPCDGCIHGQDAPSEGGRT